MDNNGLDNQQGELMMSHIRGKSSTYSSLLSITSISIQLMNIIWQPQTISCLHEWRIGISFENPFALGWAIYYELFYALLLFLYYFKSSMIELTTNDIHKQRNSSSFFPIIQYICNLYIQFVVQLHHAAYWMWHALSINKTMSIVFQSTNKKLQEVLHDTWYYKSGYADHSNKVIWHTNLKCNTKSYIW